MVLVVSSRSRKIPDEFCFVQAGTGVSGYQACKLFSFPNASALETSPRKRARTAPSTLSSLTSWLFGKGDAEVNEQESVERVRSTDARAPEGREQWVQATPALSPLGAPFTPMPKHRTSLSLSKVNPFPPSWKCGSTDIPRGQAPPKVSRVEEEVAEAWSLVCIQQCGHMLSVHPTMPGRSHWTQQSRAHETVHYNNPMPATLMPRPGPQAQARSVLRIQAAYLGRHVLVQHVALEGGRPLRQAPHSED